MTPKDILLNAVDPALALLTPLGVKSDDRARVLLMAIAGQESQWTERLQKPVAYARSFWQFERAGGVHGVLTHPASRDKIRPICADLLIPCDDATVYDAMAYHDVLAAVMARLLLWTDPAPLPAVGHTDDAWHYYERCWRPGAPRPDTWPARYGTAQGLVASTPRATT